MFKFKEEYRRISLVHKNPLICHRIISEVESGRVFIYFSFLTPFLQKVGCHGSGAPGCTVVAESFFIPRFALCVRIVPPHIAIQRLRRGM